MSEDLGQRQPLGRLQEPLNLNRVALSLASHRRRCRGGRATILKETRSDHQSVMGRGVADQTLEDVPSWQRASGGCSLQESRRGRWGTDELGGGVWPSAWRGKEEAGTNRGMRLGIGNIG
jgi:hypothetical protein